MKKLIAVLLVVCVASASFAQDTNTVKKKGGPRRQLATILFAGLGGAILGLSTLSFYGRPQDYLGNIGIGFAVGVVAGTIYVTYKSATTHDYYDDEALKPPEPGLHWSPMVTQIKKDTTALGGQLALNF